MVFFHRKSTMKNLEQQSDPLCQIQDQCSHFSTFNRTSDVIPNTDHSSPCVVMSVECRMIWQRQFVTMVMWRREKPCELEQAAQAYCVHIWDRPRAYSKRRFQPKCGVQEASCGVQSPKIWSPLLMHLAFALSWSELLIYDSMPNVHFSALSAAKCLYLLVILATNNSFHASLTLLDAWYFFWSKDFWFSVENFTL